MTKLLIATNNQGKLVELHELLAELPVELVTLHDVGIDFAVDETGATFAENAILKAAAYAQMTGLWTLADDSGLEVDALGGAPGVYTARYGVPDAITHRDRYMFLLRNLEGVPWEKRTARFRCVIAVAEPNPPSPFPGREGGEAAAPPLAPGGRGVGGEGVSASMAPPLAPGGRGVGGEGMSGSGAPPALGEGPGAGSVRTVEGVLEGYIALEPKGEGGFGYDPIFYVPEFGCTVAELPSEVKNRISHRGQALQAIIPILTSRLK